MQKLTNQIYWDRIWEELELPILVDVENSYYGQQSDHLLKTYLDKGDKKMLEVGCGTGRWLIYFHKVFGYEVYGIDNSPVACKVSRRNLELANVPGSIICTDIFENRVGKEMFDVIMSSGVIEHFSQPFSVLEKMVELLKPGGKLITSVPNMDCLIRHFQKIFDREDYDRHQRISIKDLRTFYKQLDLKIIEVDYYCTFNLLSINYSKFNSKAWKIMIWLLKKTNSLIIRILRTFDSPPESRYFSPHVFAIGEKSFR